MLIKVPQTRTLSYYRLIERDGPVKFGLRKIRITQYIPAERCAKLLDMHYGDFLYFLINHKKLMGFRAPPPYSNVVLVHPDELLKLVKQKLRAFINREVKKVPEAIFDNPVKARNGGIP